jgi:hypothetical protein
VICCNFFELQRSGLHDDASSDENDGSKYLKHDQIVAMHDVANCTPTFQHSALAELAVGRHSKQKDCCPPSALRSATSLQFPKAIDEIAAGPAWTVAN